MMNKATERGFSLLEALAALVILAAALAMIVPRVASSSEKRKIEHAASLLVTKLDLMRDRAMRSGTPMRLSIDPVVRRFKTEDGEAYVLPREISVDTGSQSAIITYQPDGTASGARFALRAASASARIEVDWLTGRTAVTFGR
ncbi:MAG: GspH/FimT family pseudopilin [Hyphomicrobium sp.]|nr:GspH/FimT family pseudopilin [Hyphomicrobium sp.]